VTQTSATVRAAHLGMLLWTLWLGSIASGTMRVSDCMLFSACLNFHFCLPYFNADRIVPDFVTTTSVLLFADAAMISGATPSFVTTSINK
jgi:hypothetical protein